MREKIFEQSMHKFHVEHSQIVRAPKDAVFKAATDYESVPKWSKFYTSIQVTKKDGNTSQLLVETHAFGMKEKGPSTAIATPPTRVELKGNPAEFVRDAVLNLEDTSDGNTKLSYTTDVEIRGVLATILGPLEKHRVESLVRDEVKSFADYVESMK
jgi:carbon monoxide dehydrogenase subunit G